jgi:hypothetical protein
LERLTLGAATAAKLLQDDGVDVVDAEVVVEEKQVEAEAGSETFNEELKERPAATSNQEEN